jgi:hypothetical protein
MSQVAAAIGKWGSVPYFRSIEMPERVSCNARSMVVRGGEGGRRAGVDSLTVVGTPGIRITWSSIAFQVIAATIEG